MLNLRTAWLFLLLVTPVSHANARENTSSTATKIASAESEYLEMRDLLIRQFSEESKKAGEEGAPWPKVEKALATLDVLIRKAIRPAGLDGFKKAGKFSLDSLVEGELGFGKLDGIVYGGLEKDEYNQSSLVVTSIGLFKKYTESHPKIPNTIEAAIASEDLVGYGLYDDAGITFFGKIPVTSKNPGAPTVAFLAHSGQDEGYSEPDEVYVAAVAGDRIFIIVKKLQKAFPDIKKCRDKFNYYADKFERVRVNLKPGEVMPDSAIQLDWKARREYVACYRENHAQLPAYVSAALTAQKLVEAVQAQP